MKAVLLAFLLLLGGAANAACKVDADKFSGASVLICGVPFAPESNALWSPLGLHANPMLTKMPDGSALWQLRLKWVARDWLFIERDTLAVFLIDGQRYELHSPNGSADLRRVDPNNVRDSPFRGAVDVEEIALFDASRDFLAAVAGAKRVEFALYLRGGRLEGSLRGGQLKPFREFIDKTVDSK